MPPVRSVSVSNGSWVADGRISIDDLADELAVGIPEGPYSTLGGLVLDLAGRIPAAGDSVEIAGLRFTVSRMDRLRVDRVRIDADPPIS